MNPIKPVKKILSHTTFAAAPAAAVFPLLCPVREYDWISDWECTLLRSDSGFNELHCLFETDIGPLGRETWLTIRYEPSTRVEFVRSSADWLVHYTITLAEDEQSTAITWTMVLTGLTQKGNQNITGMTREVYEGIMNRLGESMAYYLKHGECLPRATR